MTIKTDVHQKVSQSKTPFKLWMGRVPIVKHLQIFRSRAFVLNKEINKDKFGVRSTEDIFVGYSDEAKAY